MVCLFIVERSDTASNEALCWLVCMCLTRAECLKFVHPDASHCEGEPVFQFAFGDACFACHFRP